MELHLINLEFFSNSKKLFKATNFKAKISLEKGIEKYMNSIKKNEGNNFGSWKRI